MPNTRVFSNAEYYDMILCVGASNGSYHGARQLYRQRFVDGRPLAEQRTLPSYGCFRQMCLRLHSTGSFHGASNEGRPSTRERSNLEMQILEHFEENPSTSTRRAAAELQVNHMAVWRTLNNDGQHPYHFRRTQELLPSDFTQRLTYCQWLVQQIEHNVHFTSNVLWSDEATFTRSGVANLHNEHVWAHTNPHVSTESSYQHQWRINVWAGIYGDRLIGPKILPASMTADAYIELLTGELEDDLEGLPVARYRAMWYQQDGAPAHYARRVREILDEKFPGRWIGRGGPVPWPPRSPDLTPLDFFLWGYIKNYVYAVPCDSRDDMITRINEAFASVTQEMITNVNRSVGRRARLCIERGGQHFEPFL